MRGVVKVHCPGMTGIIVFDGYCRRPKRSGGVADDQIGVGMLDRLERCTLSQYDPVNRAAVIDDRIISVRRKWRRKRRLEDVGIASIAADEQFACGRSGESVVAQAVIEIQSATN